MIDFDGPVQCRRDGAGAVNLVLLGHIASMPAQALFAAADADSIAGLPATLHEVRLLDLAPDAADGAGRQIRLVARELTQDIAARSVQLHRDAAREFFGAVTPPHVPLGRRLGWALLLGLLRVPGVGALLVRLRGAA